MLKRFHLSLGVLLCLTTMISLRAEDIEREASSEVVRPRVFSMYDFYADYRKIMFDAFRENDDAKISEEERAGITAAGGGSPVYGEILYESVLFLLDYLQLTEDDVFYDLGSGLGKLVFQVYLMSSASKVIGIELSESRWERSQKILKTGSKIFNGCFTFENQMRKTFGKEALPKISGKKFELLKGNMLEVDLEDATVIFTCSTCFSDECMRNLTNRLAELKDGLRVLTLRHLSEHKNFHLVKTFYLPMTWSKNTPIYLYVLDRNNKPVKEDDVAPFASADEIEEEVAALQIPTAKKEQSHEGEDGIASVVLP